MRMRPSCARSCAAVLLLITLPSSNQLDTPSTNPAPSPACVFADAAPPADFLPVGARFSTAIAIPRGAHILFIGDSLMRYQYLALVYALHARSDLTFAGRAARNPLMERTWADFNDFYHGTTELLGGDEYCDCHRPLRTGALKYSFNTAIKLRTVENRHYMWRSCGVRVSYVQHFKAEDNVTGHLAYATDDPFSPAAFRSPLNTTAFDEADQRGARWSVTLTALLPKLRAALRPTVIVYNTGAHAAAVAPSKAHAIHAALHSAAPCVVYKTTSRSRDARAAALTTGVAAAFARDAVLDAARLTDSYALREAAWVSREHADALHFSAKSLVYHDLNVALLAGLYGGEPLAPPELWEARFGAAGPYVQAALVGRGTCRGGMGGKAAAPRRARAG